MSTYDFTREPPDDPRGRPSFTSHRPDHSELLVKVPEYDLDAPLAEVNAVIFSGNLGGVSTSPSVTISTETPFTYDPRRGNLLINIVVTNQTFYGDGSDVAAVWVDWNQDHTFGADEETVLSSDDGGQTFTGTVAVPGNAASGSTILRIRLLNAYSTNGLGDLVPCGVVDFGSVEDYTVNVGGSQTICCRGSTCAVVASAGDCGVPAGSPLTLIVGLDHTGRRGQPPQLSL